MFISSQITADGRKIQQQVNGYSPKLDENQSVRPSKLGGYSPKKVAESAGFSQVGGYSPKKVAAAAEMPSKYTLFIGFEGGYPDESGQFMPKCHLFLMLYVRFMRVFFGKIGWG